jgi:phosphatidylglycerophosphatase A
LRKGAVPSAVLRFLATGFGVGYSPVIPGTVGTLLGIPLYMILAARGVETVIVALCLVVPAGIYVAGRVEELSGTQDPGSIVIDEIAGYLLTMAGSPADLFHIVAGFTLFRFFDILKPPPVRQAERVFPGGAGIMLDDLLAACYAWLCLRGLEVLFL